MNFENKLINILSKKATSPFLFLGSGFSRRYIGLEKWDELLKVFAKQIGKPYGYYNSNANGVLPLVATLIAKDFQKKIWEDDAFLISVRNMEICFVLKSQHLNMQFLNISNLR